MATYKFTVAPGVTAPEGAPPLTLTNIRPVVPPAGRAKDLLDRMTGDYTAFQQARISQTLFDLLDAGILAKLDLLCIRGLTEADSLLNWVDNGRAPTNNGATFTAGEGLSTDGLGTYVDLNWEVGQYSLGDASLFVFLPNESSLGAGDVVGRAGSGGDDRCRIVMGETNASCRVNRGSGPFAPHGGRTEGLWCGTDVGGEITLYRDGDELITGSGSASHGLPNQGIAVGKSADTFTETTVSAFGYGAALTAQQAGILSSAIRAMNAVI